MNRGVSLYVVQGLLGHLHARTTQRYAHLTQETLSGAADLIQDVVAFPGVDVAAATAEVRPSPFRRPRTIELGRSPHPAAQPTSR